MLGALFTMLGAVIRKLKVGLFIFCNGSGGTRHCLGRALGYYDHWP